MLGSIKYDTSPLLGIYFAEFDNELGAKIVYQHPPNILPAERFEEISDFIISGHEFSHCRIGVNLAKCNLRIIGFPINIQHERYSRNSYFFNVGFVFHTNATTSPYHGVLEIFARWLEQQENQRNFLQGQKRVPQKILNESGQLSAPPLSSSAGHQQKNPLLLLCFRMVFEQLNLKGRCFIALPGLVVLSLALPPRIVAARAALGPGGAARAPYNMGIQEHRVPIPDDVDVDIEADAPGGGGGIHSMSTGAGVCPFLRGSSYAVELIRGISATSQMSMMNNSSEGGKGMVGGIIEQGLEDTHSLRKQSNTSISASSSLTSASTMNTIVQSYSLPLANALLTKEEDIYEDKDSGRRGQGHGHDTIGMSFDMDMGIGIPTDLTRELVEPHVMLGDDMNGIGLVADLNSMESSVCNPLSYAAASGCTTTGQEREGEEEDEEEFPSPLSSPTTINKRQDDHTSPSSSPSSSPLGGGQNTSKQQAQSTPSPPFISRREATSLFSSSTSPPTMNIKPHYCIVPLCDLEIALSSTLLSKEPLCARVYSVIWNIYNHGTVDGLNEKVVIAASEDGGGGDGAINTKIKNNALPNNEIGGYTSLSSSDTQTHKDDTSHIQTPSYHKNNHEQDDLHQDRHHQTHQKRISNQLKTHSNNSTSPKQNVVNENRTGITLTIGDLAKHCQGIHVTLTTRALTQLIYIGMCGLTDPFRLSNIYTTTSHIAAILTPETMLYTQIHNPTQVHASYHIPSRVYPSLIDPIQESDVILVTTPQGYTSCKNLKTSISQHGNMCNALEMLRLNEMIQIAHLGDIGAPMRISSAEFLDELIFFSIHDAHRFIRNVEDIANCNIDSKRVYNQHHFDMHNVYTPDTTTHQNMEQNHNLSLNHNVFISPCYHVVSHVLCAMDGIINMEQLQRRMTFKPTYSVSPINLAFNDIVYDGLTPTLSMQDQALLMCFQNSLKTVKNHDVDDEYTFLKNEILKSLDLRRFVHYCVLHGIIKRKHEYPCLLLNDGHKDHSDQAQAFSDACHDLSKYHHHHHGSSMENEDMVDTLDANLDTLHVSDQDDVQVGYSHDDDVLTYGKTDSDMKGIHTKDTRKWETKKEKEDEREKEVDTHCTIADICTIKEYSEDEGTEHHSQHLDHVNASTKSTQAIVDHEIEPRQQDDNQGEEEEEEDVGVLELTHDEIMATTTTTTAGVVSENGIHTTLNIPHTPHSHPNSTDIPQIMVDDFDNIALVAVLTDELPQTRQRQHGNKHNMMSSHHHHHPILPSHKHMTMDTPSNKGVSSTATPSTTTTTTATTTTQHDFSQDVGYLANVLSLSSRASIHQNGNRPSITASSAEIQRYLLKTIQQKLDVLASQDTTINANPSTKPSVYSPETAHGETHKDTAPSTLTHSILEECIVEVLPVLLDGSRSMDELCYELGVSYISLKSIIQRYYPQVLWL